MCSSDLSGSLNTAVEDGAIEYNGTRLYSTIGTDRKEIVRGGTYSVSLTPTAVAANSESLQTYTVSGLIVPEAVCVSPPASISGLGIMSVRCSTTDTLEILWRNFTGGSLTPPSGNYKVMAGRV